MPTLIAMRSFLQQLAYLLRDIIGRETKIREHVGRLARGAEAVDAEHPTRVAHVAPPALGRTRLHGKAARQRARQDGLAVRGVLRVERLGRGHRHQARSEEHTSELQSRRDLVCRLLLEKKKKNEDDFILERKKNYKKEEHK